MAVPKKKTSTSKRNMRRSHHAIKPINVIIDKDTGEYRLPHTMDKSSGMYNDKQIHVEKEKESSEEDSDKK